VLCSTATRARETLELVAPAGEVLIESGLYDATAYDLLERLRRIPGNPPSVMLIGHNPALRALVLRVAGTRGLVHPRDSDLAAVQEKFPTAALAALELTVDWGDLEPGGGRLVSLTTPKRLR
jgi:phosphohistidine phosphatase